MRGTSKRSKACDISPSVKSAVAERDSIDGYPCCILCGNPQCAPNAHYIPRSQGGLGVPENIITLCSECHSTYDDSGERKAYRERIRAYLQSIYPEWDESKLTYRKYG